MNSAKNLILILVFVFLTSCSLNSTKDISSKTISRDQVSIVYDPGRFINKINGKRLWANLFFDPNNVVQLTYVDPGDLVIDTIYNNNVKTVGLNTYYTEWKFKVRFDAQPGRIYYFYVEDFAATPRVRILDIGDIEKVSEIPVYSKKEMSGLSIKESKNRQAIIDEFTKEMKAIGKPVEFQVTK
jgi:hypothetical protein